MYTTPAGDRRSLRRRPKVDSLLSDEEGAGDADLSIPFSQISSSSSTTVPAATRLAMGLPVEGTLRCVCGAGSDEKIQASTTAATISSSQGLPAELVECAICFFCCHKACVNVSGWSHVALRAFLCPFCAGGVFKRPRERAQMLAEAGHSGDIGPVATVLSDKGSTPAQAVTTKVKINEVKDRDPTPASMKPLLQQTLQALVDSCASMKAPATTTTLKPPATSGRPKKRAINADGDGAGSDGYDIIFVPPLHSDTYLPSIPSTDSDNDDAEEEPPRTNGRRTEEPAPEPSSPPTPTGGRRSIFKHHRRNAEEAASLLPEPPSMSASSPHHRPSSSPHKEAPPTSPLTGGSAAGKMASVLTDARMAESLECCQSAIANATFSDSYPQYILNELRVLPHQYLQGTFAVDRKTQKVVALVVTNGMDVYGNLKPTLSLLRSAMTRWGAADAQPPMRDKKPPKRATVPVDNASAPLPEELRGKVPDDAFLFNGAIIQPFMLRMARDVEDVSGFVHFNLIATHTDHRGRGLAKRLMLAESLRWQLRGRTHAYLNMALERVRVTRSGRRVPYVANSDDADEEEGNVICVFSEASRRLYVAMGFHDVYPRFDPVTGENKWTAREEEGGRVMANLDMNESSRRIASEVIGPDVPLVSGRRVLRLKSRNK